MTVSMTRPSSRMTTIARAKPTINAPNVTAFAPSIKLSNVPFTPSVTIPAIIPMIKKDAVNSVKYQPHSKIPITLSVIPPIKTSKTKA